MSAKASERPLVRLLAFAGLALYGVFRWATLTPSQGHGRLLGLLGLAVALSAIGPFVVRRSRTLAALLAGLALLVALGLAGVPLAWIAHLRVGLTSQWVGNGMADLPGVLTPYLGSDRWILLVFTLGAAVLLLDGAIVMAFAPSHFGGLRRVAAALPLVALAAIPAALVHPRSPYLDGFALFALLCAFVWGEQVRRRRLAVAIVLCTAAGGAALALAPGLQIGKPWLDYEGAANRLLPGAGAETFDWSQSYGPITWPRNDKPVVEVAAARGDYWKTEDLDAFDGRGWAQAVIGGAQQLPAPSPEAVTRWTQRIAVRLRDMKTTDLIGAGMITGLTHLPKPVVPGAAPGTWSTASPLLPGDSYQAEVYSPHPTATQLDAAGSDYTAVPAAYRAAQLGPGSPEVVFGGFHSGQSPLLAAGPELIEGQAFVAASPYARAFNLAQSLAAQADTPEGFVQQVMRWLRHGYTYVENPPPSAYPLESFLFVSRKGYCQQFAGAMALLLRMGGLPARVATGFTPGTYDSTSRRWVVTDMDAHAWVETWFPSYGWVRFDPTPPADPALQASVPPDTTPAQAAKNPPARPNRARPQRASHPAANPVGSVRDGRTSASAGGPSLWMLIAVALLLVAGATLGFAARPLRDPEAAIGELERAFSRSRCPLRGGMTLAGLERRLHDSPAAAEYVRRLRASRYGGGARMPSAAQRRALRQHLAAGPGLRGRLRALWALPPRRRVREAGFGPSPGA